MSAHRKRWHLLEVAPTEFLQALGQSNTIATLLYQRGLRHPDNVNQFLHATYPAGLHDPFLMKGMTGASQRVAQAIQNGESIAVYGDFDTDGVTAVSLLQQAISAMGGNIRPYIPHRVREGYGLNSEAIEQLAAEGTNLLITVDCGISNVDEVARASALGLDVVVTDHHTPPAVLPNALAVVNPKQPGCTYPYNQLVGVGIAFKLVQALLKQGMRSPLRGRDMLDLVALGTIADVAPLDGENRMLVKAGLDAINMTQRPGLRALITAAGLRQGSIDSTAVAFLLAPRINAAGRLDDAIRAYDLLLCDDESRAEQLAQELNQANRQRQSMTEEVQRLAREQASATGKLDHRIVLLDSEHFPAGVVGLVAGKLVEAWSRPVVLIERGETTSRGSARSVVGFNIVQALTECKDLFVRFGGHSMAAGFTLETSRLEELEEQLLQIAERDITDDMLVPVLAIDAEVELADVGWNLFRELRELEPFGQGNRQPVLMSRNVQALDVRAMGKNEQHLKLRLASNQGKPIEAVAFRLGHLAEPLQRHPWIDVVYTLETNEWGETHSIQLNMKDFRRGSRDS